MNRLPIRPGVRSAIHRAVRAAIGLSGAAGGGGGGGAAAPSAWTFTTSSNYYTAPDQAKLSDGLANSTATVWASNNSHNPAWIVADFGGDVLISTIHLGPIPTAVDGWGPRYTNSYDNGMGAATVVKFQTWNGSAWVDLHTMPQDGAPGACVNSDTDFQIDVATLYGEVVTSKVRMLSTHNSAPPYMGVSELWFD